MPVAATFADSDYWNVIKKLPFQNGTHVVDRAYYNNALTSEMTVTLACVTDCP